jgi:beta-glucosidase
MFSKDFIWGAATSAAQIEGAEYEDGKTSSIWDIASRMNDGRFSRFQKTPLSSCDHYHRFIEDVAIMKKIGLKAYRFSISWTRLMKEDMNTINPKGLLFYNRLIDALLDAGIEPFITIFHWDYPQSLLDQGGWQNDKSVTWFAEYAKTVVELFSDRVKKFITINEPECFVNLGYLDKRHAPYYQLPEDAVFKIAHNVLKANGLATILMRQVAKQKIEIGQAFALTGAIPFSENDKDINAAKHCFFNHPDSSFWGTWFLDTIMNGEYDKKRLAKISISPDVLDKDMRIIHQTPDFIGFNMYSGTLTKHLGENDYQRMPDPIDSDYTMMDIPIAPSCLYWAARFLYEKYHLPIYIMENGVAITDSPDENGDIDDPARINFIREHLIHLSRALKEKIDVRGYFYWSLLDNYEWAHGYSRRFGLVRVNFENYKRTLKKSAYWYASLIKSNGKILEKERVDKNYGNL